MGFGTLRLEGALLLPDLLEKAAQGQARLQQPEDYHVPRGFTLQEEIGRAFRIAQAQWKAFSADFERTDVDPAAGTRAFATEFLRDALSYADTRTTASRTVGERTFPVTLQAATNLPVVIAPPGLDLDDPDPAFAPLGGGARKKSPFQLLQEFLNAEPDARWGFATNGRKLRLARDAATLTRPSFIEFDLETMLGQARYPDFAALWRLLHASRATRRPDPVWETWRNDGQREGARVREGLRIGVEAALVTLGEGFLKHPANEPLRRALIAGDLKRQAYFEELLRLVYRFIFLFAVEERGLLHPADDSPAAAAARRIYHQGYGARRLRERCLRRVARDAHDDLWQAQVIVFRALATGEPRLALPALGGLFSPAQCPYLDAASLSNRALLEAMRSLRWSQASGTVAPVDYRNMGPEELGSVYESLLELVPDPDPHARTFAFVNASADGDTKGNARKTTGSYYTPDSLVQELIRSALDPVIDTRVAGQPDRPTEALLGITVVDPACGSGHFLLAAARRLAERLAALRAPEGAVRAQDYRRALREVITHCIYGVDRNPMALELARFALWLEGFEEGRPLGFLDHHLVCGDALIGITDVGQLAYGIPDAAFKPLSGDDKAVCRTLAKENREGLKAFAKRKLDANLPLALERDSLLAERAALEAMPDDTLAQQAAKDAAWKRYADQARASRLQQAADLFVGAFLAPKAAPQDVERTATSRNLYLALFTDQPPEALAQAKQADRLAHATQCALDARVLHWPLAFVQVFQRGGFDCVLGNPPWEVSQLGEVEYFATRAPDIARLPGDVRKQAIASLSETDPRVWQEYVADKRRFDASNTFFRESKRYPLTAVGKINSYPLFAEAIDQTIGQRGRAGFIVPTGIATDDSTKAFFAHVAQGGRLVSLYDFENRDGVFPGVHRSYKFCLLTLGAARSAEFGFFFTQTAQLADERRRFTLTAEDFARISPNTLTCPVFRSRQDAELTRKIYERVPVLIREARNGEPEVNSWGLRFSQGLFNMTSDSHLFAGEPAADRLPLYEAKMIHQYDHRWATYRGDGGADVSVDVPLADKRDPAYAVRPRYWVEAREVFLRTAALPKGLLTALRERNRPVIVLAVAHLLFADWLIRRHHTADEAMQHLYAEWCAFVEAQPFARRLAPTQLGLCGNNPPCLEPLGPHYLPAEGTDSVKAGPRESTAWYEAETGAVAALLDVPRVFPILPEALQTFDGEEAALGFAEWLLEAASPKWLMGWRDICRSTDERTVIASVLPLQGTGDTLLLMFPDPRHGPKLAGLLADQCSLVHDFTARQKVGGTHLKYHTKKQIPVVPPNCYSDSDLAFIVPRVLELTYTAHDLAPWAAALSYEGPPFPFDPDRRAQLRAELDAYYARLYGLTREDLCYILDPASVMGEDYPSETFRVLKANEEREFGEYRTQRLVLAAWDRLSRED